MIAFDGTVGGAGGYNHACQVLLKESKMASRPPFKFSIYTIRAKEELKKAANTTRTTTLDEARVWRTGQLLWQQADTEGKEMPVVFADAGKIGRLLYWGILTRVEINEKTKRTSYSFKQMRKIKGEYFPQDLRLNSTGKNIGEGFIRPYAICKELPFLEY